MIIYLTGMMGAGKTAVARYIGQRTSLKVIDLDAQIEKACEKTIAEIFRSEGEAFFRSIETRELVKTSTEKEAVVALGGGALINDANYEIMRTTGTIIYLEASLESLWTQVQKNSNRPLLRTENPRKTLEEIFLKRKSVYESRSDLRIDTNGKSVDQIAEAVMLAKGLMK